MTHKDFAKSKAALLKAGLKLFPSDFISADGGKKFRLPEKPIILGKEFFGSHEINTTEGTHWYTTPDINEAKFLIYSRQNGNREVILPEDKNLLNDAVTSYEQYLDIMMKETASEFQKLFPGEDSSETVASVFRLLNLVRY